MILAPNADSVLVPTSQTVNLNVIVRCGAFVICLSAENSAVKQFASLHPRMADIPLCGKQSAASDIVSDRHRVIAMSDATRHTPPVPGSEPKPKPDPEPEPGSEPDVVPPVNPEPEPGSTPDVGPPEPEPAPM